MGQGYSGVRDTKGDIGFRACRIQKDGRRCIEEDM